MRLPDASVSDQCSTGCSIGNPQPNTIGSAVQTSWDVLPNCDFTVFGGQVLFAEDLLSPQLGSYDDLPEEFDVTVRDMFKAARSGDFRRLGKLIHKH
jgi:hypothetical protein